MRKVEERKIIDTRTSGWLIEFINHTDEKAVTADLLAKFFINLRLTNLAPHLFHIPGVVVLDIGVATGDLSSQIKRLLEGMQSGDVNYNGIELDRRSMARAQRKIGGGVIVSEDGFAPASVIKDSLQLEAQPDIL